MRGDVGRRFLVEWYHTGLAALAVEDAIAQLADAEGGVTDIPPTALLMAVNLTDDHTLFGVFAAANRSAVVRICERAGWPADRISTDVRVWPQSVRLQT